MHPTTYDTIDDTAHKVVAAALALKIDNHTARCRLAELILKSKVAFDVSRYQEHLSTQQRDDLAENLLTMLVSRVLDPTSTFELERVVTGSLCGWARMFAVSAAPYDQAVRPRGAESKNLLVNPIQPDASTDLDFATSRFHASMAFEGQSAEDLVLSDWADPGHTSAVLDRVSNLTGFVRQPQRDRAGGAALREVLGLPSLCVPVDPAERTKVLNLVLADETLAHRALVQMAAMVCTEPPSRPMPGEEPVGELLLSVWDDYDPDHLESLMVRPGRATHLVVVDAMTPLPKLSRAAFSTLTRSVRCASAAKGWGITQQGLVAAFLATCTEPVSSCDDTNDTEAKAVKRDTAKAAAVCWPALAAKVAVFPGSPLGRTPEHVGARVRELMEEAYELDVDVRIGSRTRRGLGAAGPVEEAA